MNKAIFPPHKIALHKEQAELHITWRNGELSCISGDDLRRYCACSGCRARQVVGLRLVTDTAEIASVALMGSNAMQAVFSDGHDRGIYPWAYLYAIAHGRAQGYFDE